MIQWLKELWMLISMLFSKTAYPVDENIETVITKYFPFKNYSYMAWCGKVITRRSIEMSFNTKTEELFHLKQACYYKYWFQFYLVYVWEWIKGNPILSPSYSAYYTIPFEMQAQANRGNINYEPTREDLKSRYTIKHRKSTYKKHRDDWKNYIRAL